MLGREQKPRHPMLGCTRCGVSFPNPLARRKHEATCLPVAPSATARPADNRVAPNSAELRLQIQQAVAREDYHSAALLKEQLTQQQQRPPSPSPPLAAPAASEAAAQHTAQSTAGPLALSATNAAARTEAHPASPDGTAIDLVSAQELIKVAMKQADIQMMARPLQLAKAVRRVFDGPNADVAAMQNMSVLSQLPVQYIRAAMCNPAGRIHPDLPLASLLWDLSVISPADTPAIGAARRAITEKRAAGGLRPFMEGADAALQRAVVTTTLDGDSGSGSVVGKILTRELVVGRATKLDATVIKSMAQMVEMLCADSVVIKSHDNGFFANWLQVVDVLVHIREQVPVQVDWTVTGQELHFTFGDSGTNLWDQLFHPLEAGAESQQSSATACSTSPTARKPPVTSKAQQDKLLALRAQQGQAAKPKHTIPPAAASAKQSGSFTCVSRFNPIFYSCYRRLFFDDKCSSAQRAAYHRAATRIRIRHPQVLQLVEEHRILLGESYAIAVHKRVHTPGVVDNQSDYMMPTLDMYLQRTQEVVDAAKRKTGQSVRIYLASDDLIAVPAFERQFGELLIVRHDVKRTAGGLQENGQQNEVHMIAGNATEQEAVDVLVDVHTMALCHDLVHIDSNVSTSVAIINPNIVPHHVMTQ